MSNPAVLDTIASYLPALIVRRLVANPTPIPLPTAEERPAAVLFADISGFTALTERLAAEGPAGAEQLTRLLNTYFGRLIDIVTAHGGDVVKFAGDALLAVWEDAGDTLDNLTRRAAQCALAVQGELLGYETPEGVRLALRVAVAAGPVRHLHLGGVFGRCEFLAVGEPFADVVAANKQVRPEDVVAAPSAWRLIEAGCEGEPLPSGDVRLLAVRQPLPPRALERLRLTAELEKGETEEGGMQI
jgi:class 3 adenylate cyclase